MKWTKDDSLSNLFGRLTTESFEGRRCSIEQVELQGEELSEKLLDGDQMGTEFGRRKENEQINETTKCRGETIDWEDTGEFPLDPSMKFGGEKRQCSVKSTEGILDDTTKKMLVALTIDEQIEEKVVRRRRSNEDRSK